MAESEDDDTDDDSSATDTIPNRPTHKEAGKDKENIDPSSLRDRNEDKNPQQKTLVRPPQPSGTPIRCIRLITNGD